MHQPDALFSGLQPAAVVFCHPVSDPACFKQEAALRDALLTWARGQGVGAEIDPAGNLIIRKPATPGREHCPGVRAAGPSGHGVPEEFR